MSASNVMTEPVISIRSDASILEAVRIMLQNKISGLPVVDDSGRLVGIVSEGDFLRRVETGTLRRRPRWIEFVVGPGRLADEYVHASSRKVEEIMTPEVHTTTEGASLDEVVRMMERYGVKRIPVLRGRELVGIITRANLMRALVSAAMGRQPVPGNDAEIRERLLAHLSEQPWAPAIDVAVADGVVTLSGMLTDERQRQALCVAAENIPGVQKVEDRLAWIIPGTGLVGEPPLVVGPTPR